jgi:hypothetical protein
MNAPAPTPRFAPEMPASAVADFGWIPMNGYLARLL